MKKISQRDAILAMLKASPSRRVTCRTLADAFLFHKAASRISELRAQGHTIRYVPGPSVMESYYELVSEPVRFKVEQNGQLVAFA